MIDVEKQVAFWRQGAEEDWAVAHELIAGGRSRHALFFAHLALEKLLKACIVSKSGDLAPRLHNLVRLAELAGLPLSEAQIDLLSDMNAFNLEGRYPESSLSPPTQAEAQAIMEQADKAFTWLTNQF
jgi:HEPN domain-containing protein